MPACTCSTTPPSESPAAPGPYLYLPKLESHHEARLWNEVFIHAQAELGVPRGSVRATVLIETITAAFEMDEILYELREHAAGLNAGRWDYLFSAIKRLRSSPDLASPDRSQLTMTVPFMRAYTELLVQTCHKRGAHAIGGMAAFIPNRRDPEVTETALAKVREDKERESRDGFDGTWVAHPDLVPVATEVFDAVLGSAPNQKDRLREDVSVTAAELLDLTVGGGSVTEAGVRANIRVALAYLDAWLGGTGAAAIDNLMEDAATAEIARSQLWLWRTRDLLPIDAIRDDPRRGARSTGWRHGRPPQGRLGRARPPRPRRRIRRIPDAAGLSATGLSRHAKPPPVMHISARAARPLPADAPRRHQGIGWTAPGCRIRPVKCTSGPAVEGPKPAWRMRGIQIQTTHLPQQAWRIERTAHPTAWPVSKREMADCARPLARERSR